jgi:hypothetical protein
VRLTDKPEVGYGFSPRPSLFVANSQQRNETQGNMEFWPRWSKRGVPPQPQTVCCQYRLFVFSLVSQHTFVTHC